MALTLEQIVEETRLWSPEKVGELLGKLTAELHATDPEVQAAWEMEIDRRVHEICSGKVEGIPLDESLARIRKLIQA